ncbi:hypothetical protein OZL92_08420 [Bacillus sonorensis]|mgnify:FL=1|uniref:DUF3951 domain-containing protein n=1 Tax=Bacillus sonorensis TaxID=119858 RepID=A0ABN5AAT3_9BACI|nr:MULTISPECIES: hypothetical protein [Bacillus]TWK80589.1 hypothetical protein CHCC20335_0543 [Bacillus paralicheniformis]ASB87122.1 hypothetical protein S101395_00567 [Bacillus sonorensis]MCF7616370.1 hypothetical protein [Bacillus sonorensis]MCY7857704.1 hypothetical protein [Bacillus sonorensis]MCY8023615.1 hypothetical protein [Bacillus sonorensis]
MLLQILVGGLFVFIVFFLIFRGIKSGHLPRHDQAGDEDAAKEHKDERL